MVPNPYIGGGRFLTPVDYCLGSGFDHPYQSAAKAATPSNPGRYGYFSGCILQYVEHRDLARVLRTGQHPQFGKLITWQA